MLASPRTALFDVNLRISDPGDVARIFIEDVLVAETTAGTTVGRGQIYLLRGSLHTITVEFHELTGSAAISLQWSSREIAQQSISAYYFYPRWLPLRGSPFPCELLANGSFTSLLT